MKVVAFTTFLVGPAAAQYLADMGADVVKIEEPRHGPHERRWSGANHFLNGESILYLMSTRNTRSIGLDLKSEAGRKVARRMCDEADVVVSNFRPGVMDRLGLGFDDLRQSNPGLVYASASGYGARSPHRHLPGQDLLVQSISGIASVTGSEGPPVASGAVVADQHAATLLALGIAGALVEKARTGLGQEVEVTMLQASLDLQAEVYAYHLNGADLRRPRNGLATTYHEAPYGYYKVTDGYVALSINPIAKISAALGAPTELEPYLNPDLAFSAREDIYDALEPLLTSFKKDELVKLFREHDIWCAPVKTYEDLDTDEVIASLNAIEEFEHPVAGTVRVVGHPIKYSSGTAAVHQVPPALGEHTHEILAELGYDHATIDSLSQEGTIRA
ncbi:CaiB/BaiF CoA-transferase family protein [Aeromicrobium sp. 9AM]|uniref:CaiB/BaiF CoA transferase family protein n=1 Tax=Aeromicrobium sp. 9AM TaxID=2653126 RepID=UPI00135ACC47|nr:CaiB/BaiF CoA-transferase family protein [Aeromicrobium sp. 9AM]